MALGRPLISDESSPRRHLGGARPSVGKGVALTLIVSLRGDGHIGDLCWVFTCLRGRPRSTAIDSPARLLLLLHPPCVSVCPPAAALPFLAWP